jgi:peptide chain release factor 2
MQNRAVAMRILKSRLVLRAQEERDAEIAALQGEKREIGFGSQIRSYVLHPYQMVKDHRTGTETGNVQAVLDGALDEFIEAELRRRASETGEAPSGN